MPPPEETHPLDRSGADPYGTEVIAPPTPITVRPGACLVHIHPKGPTLGHRYLLGSELTLIGRDDACSIHSHDRSVSRAHARLDLQSDGRHKVIDLDSTNGTYVNDARVRAVLLRDGDYLRLGSSIYRYLAGGNLETDYHEEIHRLTVLDPLTGLPNRRAFDEFLARELGRAARHDRPIAVVLFDIDHFKLVNDRLGHVAGDLTLRGLADRVRGLIRSDELLARYGGEEFAVVLPEATAGPAGRCAERIRRAIADRPFEFDSRTYPVTVSGGVGMRAAHESITAAELIERADRLLYQAKRGGRNRVCGGESPA